MRYQSLSIDALGELVAQYHHRLLSLEADLKDQARSGTVSPRNFSKRVKRLQQVHRLLVHMQRISVAASTRSLHEKDIGLPILSECTPAEKSVCEEHLLKKEATLMRLERESTQVYRWVLETANGRSSALRSTFRLSRMRRLIQQLHRQGLEFETELQTQGAAIHRIMDVLGSPRLRHAAEGILSGLSGLFHQLDGAISRVAKLRAAVKKEEAKIKKKEDWLKTHRAQLHSATEGFTPPSPLATAWASAVSDVGPDKAFFHNRKRLLLAEAFWEQLTNRERLNASAVHAMAPTILTPRIIRKIRKKGPGGSAK